MSDPCVLALQLFGATERLRSDILLAAANQALPLIDRIERIACGEEQLGANDGDGLHFIYILITEWKNLHCPEPLP